MHSRKLQWILSWLILEMVVLTSAFDVKADNLSPTVLHSKADISFRAITVMDRRTILVGGSSGTLMRSTDGGESWTSIQVCEESAELDFRDLESMNNGNVLLMSAGAGKKSRIFQSEDSGQSWTQRYGNRIPEGFFNGLACWPDGTGMLVGDPVEGDLFLMKTFNFGRSWKRIRGPELKPGEYGFAASGTGIVASTPGKVTIATGGSTARILDSSDFGKTWVSKEVSVRDGNESSGIFSVAVTTSGTAIAVGGDYKSPLEDKNNYVYRTSTDSEWLTGKSKLPHKACVRFLDGDRVVCSGQTGIAISHDGGKTWNHVSNESYYTFDFDSASQTLFFAGADGRIARMRVSVLDAKR